MFGINDIIKAILADKIRISDHADEEAENDQLTFDEIYYAVTHGKIIEKYAKDKPFPSVLILGQTFSGEPIHSVWAYNKENKWAVIITVYRPNPNLWTDFKKRRVKR